jgi:hypothetical protein
MGLIISSSAEGQRGTGEQEGVARQGIRPEVRTIAAVLKEIKTDPCERTTGASPIGTHLVLEADDDQINVHLGPASEVGDVVGMVRVGDTVEVTAFRTQRLPENQYIAISVKTGEDKIVLRDASLRPRWARGSGIGQRGPMRDGRGPGMRGPRLANSRVLADANQLQLTDVQVDAIEKILAEAENRIRKVLTEQQLSTLDSRPRGGRRGPR